MCTGTVFLSLLSWSCLLCIMAVSSSCTLGCWGYLLLQVLLPGCAPALVSRGASICHLPWGIITLSYVFWVFPLVPWGAEVHIYAGPHFEHADYYVRLTESRLVMTPQMRSKCRLAWVQVKMLSSHHYIQIGQSTPYIMKQSKWCQSSVTLSYICTSFHSL